MIMIYTYNNQRVLKFFQDRKERQALLSRTL